MMEQIPLYWLLDIEAYEFNTGYIRDADLKGKALILSRQLWSMVRGSEVVSALIGPGIFKGTAESGNRQAQILERISALIFNPSQLRFDEPLPLVDIINPEIIDPIGTSKQEEIVTVIKQLVVEKGNILSEDPLAKVKGSGLPTIMHYQEMIKKISVSHISGTQRARFILGGTNGPMYRPFLEWMNARKFMGAEQSKILATQLGRFGPFTDSEIMDDWMIVEKAGQSQAVGGKAVEEEYSQTYSFVNKNADSYIFEV